MDPRRALPSVERVQRELDGLPGALLTAAARDAVDAARAAIADGATPTEADVVADATARVAEQRRRLLQPVINATGVLLHTNLGRAPIGEEALAAALAIGGGASSLELNLTTGTRGSRHDHAGALLARTVGAEAGMVVNNNAAAVLLTLGALARGHEVVVSRGELVEIGGGFRVPEIMAESGCALIEVGTTNRTRVADYERAVTESTALLLKVHASNYRMVGFTEATPVQALAGLGPTVMVDAGSGLLDETTPWLPARPAWLRDEPGIRQAIADGAGVVTFSGDKLLGGPQAGIIVGRADLLATIAKHPLARAMRADKLTLAALQQVALIYLSGDATAIPLWRMATADVASLRTRAERMVTTAPGATIVDTEAVAGGGSLPGLTIPSLGVRCAVARVDDAMSELRAVGIIARADGDGVLCDLRSVDPTDDDIVARALADL